ncbi:hypothetical protein CRV03_07115 [Arcobacter sp. F155]|uniref:Hachiman antiphage defense system protein HamA n=1 Tax=Arcobacter sp. F155 TaxID=2044512 RepID=UPI00100AC406|nr:Hachiman antiphage defense system protein HamA [Arcobacter sp. F155]RXJ77026.1 hypothetical protein CRV03_07115 [Arcobacter sp. F155]
MLDILSKSNINTILKDEHSFTILELKDEHFQEIVQGLIDLVPEYYIAPESVADVLTRLGKSAAAKKILDKTPTVKKIRSGDIGEIITSDYIDESTNYNVPIKKLRWKDHRNMAMRGDDILGIYINPSDQCVKFLKAEAKSYQSLSQSVLDSARSELDNDNGLPSPHALSFVIDRLRETGSIDLANKLEKVQLVDGINQDHVEHLLFTFTKTNSGTLQKNALETYSDNIKQTSISLRTNKHQELINQVYEGIINANS